MTKKVYILFIFVLGFALIPRISHACSSSSEKSCCKKENSEKSIAQGCCKKEKQHSNGNDNCGGTCGDKSCHCLAFHFSIMISIFQEGANNSVDFLHEKQIFSHLEINLSSGFYSIWTPPNIG